MSEMLGSKMRMTEAYLYLNIIYFLCGEWKQLLHDGNVRKCLVKAFLFFRLMDKVLCVQYIYHGVILERNGLHVKPATAALKG